MAFRMGVSTNYSAYLFILIVLVIDAVTSASFNGPWKNSIDPNDKLIITDAEDQNVLKLEPGHCINRDINGRLFFGNSTLAAEASSVDRHYWENMVPFYLHEDDKKYNNVDSRFSVHYTLAPNTGRKIRPGIGKSFEELTEKALVELEKQFPKSRVRVRTDIIHTIKKTLRLKDTTYQVIVIVEVMNVPQDKDFLGVFRAESVDYIPVRSPSVYPLRFSLCRVNSSDLISIAWN